MSGFSTSRCSIDNIAKQYGSILRGYGPPVPKAGVIGDLYIDVLTFNLFEKRCTNSLDDWGHCLFTVPPSYKNTLKWFGSGRPDDKLGLAGDYFMQWAGYDNYGMQLTIFGPKLITGWPENGGDTTTGGPPITTAKVLPLGVSNEGSLLTDLMPNQLIAVGLLDEYFIPLSVTANPGEPVSPIGVPSTGKLVLITFNPLYTAEDEHAL
jgi:hypothetical protein